jgi:hypothetical protein
MARVNNKECGISYTVQAGIDPPATQVIPQSVDVAPEEGWQVAKDLNSYPEAIER